MAKPSGSFKSCHVTESSVSICLGKIFLQTYVMHIALTSDGGLEKLCIFASSQIQAE